MVQFYVLAIVINFLGGALLAGEYLGERLPFLRDLRHYFKKQQSARIVFMILGLVTAVFKILSVTDGDIPVVGDLLPAVSLLLVTFITALDYYIDRSDVESAGRERLEAIFLSNESVFGIGAMLVAVLHFFFPGVLFL